MSLTTLMIHLVDIDTETVGKSDFGGTLLTWSRKASSVPARVTDPTPDDASVLYGKFDAQRHKVVYFISNQNLTVKDRIVIQNQPFQVHSVRDMGGNLNRLWRVDCAQKSGGQ